MCAGLRALLLAFMGLASALGLSLQADAQEGKRFALVVGNSQYVNERVSDLPNAARDATEIAASLKALGFEVDLGIDLNQQDFKNLVSDFRAKIKQAQAKDVVFYYAGHGFSFDGFNHLVPSDAILNNKERLAYETLTLDEVIGSLRATDKQNTIVFLDSCRNNPLPEKLRGDDTAAGFSELKMSLRGIHVSFATEFGQLTGDGLGDNSPYARALLRYIDVPGLSLSGILRRVTNSVAQETSDKQYPVDQGGLREDFYFTPPDQQVPETEVVAEADPAQVDNGDSAPAVDNGEVQPGQADEASQPKAEVEPELQPKTVEAEPQPKTLVADAAAASALAEQASPGTADSEAPQELTVAALEEGLASSTADVIEGTVVDDPAKLGGDEPAPAQPKVAEPAPAATVPDAPAPPEDVAKSAPQTVTADSGTAQSGLEQAGSGNELAADTKMASLQQDGTSRTIDQISSDDASPAPSAPDTIENAGSGASKNSITPARSGEIASADSTDVITGEEWVPPEQVAVAEPVSPPASGLAAEPVAPKVDSNSETQVAMLTPPAGEVEAEPPSVEIARADLARRVQEQLKRVGCFAGAADGNWGRKSEQAFQEYNDRKGWTSAPLNPSLAALGQLEAETEKICVADQLVPKKVKPAAPKRPVATPKPTKKTAARPAAKPTPSAPKKTSPPKNTSKVPIIIGN
jgi:hypothetical protein